MEFYSFSSKSLCLSFMWPRIVRGFQGLVEIEIFQKCDQKRWGIGDRDGQYSISMPDLAFKSGLTRIHSIW